MQLMMSYIAHRPPPTGVAVAAQDSAANKARSPSPSSFKLAVQPAPSPAQPSARVPRWPRAKSPPSPTADTR